MSAYLARLKQIESEKISAYTPESVPSKPSKAPFEPFEGTCLAHIEEKLIDEIVPILEVQREARRQKVLAMLEAAPEINRAIYPDTESDKENVILAIAVRHVATFEMLVPKASYDPWQLMQLMNSAKGLH